MPTAIATIELSQLETIIERGEKTFVEVGLALQEIRDTKYKKNYATFEDYCRKRSVTKNNKSQRESLSGLATIHDKSFFLRPA